MKRITPPFLVKTILLAFAAFLSIMLVQCKKMDISQEEISIDLPERDAPVRKFLKTNQHTRPEVRAIAQKIIRQEEEKPFLEKFVTYAGYPDWGKSITLSKSIGGSAATIGKTGSTDHSETVIIPFSFDRDSTLNAILKVTLSAEDTTFQMLYRWQYNQHGYEKNDSVNNADQTALFFMAYESFLFGHKTFRIKDTSLLKGSRSSDVIKITSFNAANTSAKMMQNSIEICFEADCPEPVQTYYAKTSSSIVIIPGICLSCFTYTYWYDDGEPLGGTNGGGSSSNNGGNNSNNGSGNIPGQDADGGGGSSSNNNNWSDDPCNTSNGGGIIHREQPVPGCNEAPAWEPVEELNLTDLDLKELLNLTYTQTTWLNNNMEFKNVILAELEADNYSDESITVAKIIIDQGTNNLLNAAWGEAFGSVAFSHLVSYYESCCPGMLNPISIIGWTSQTAADYAWNRKMHPEWSKAKCLWEATKESVHTVLDVTGMIPVVGEVFDLANGVLYTIEGDGLNATLSFAAMLPIAGWAANGVKYAKKINGLTFKVVGTGASKLVTFGSYNSAKLRKALGIAKGDVTKQAHHVLPRADKIMEHPVVQRATQVATNQGFHIDDVLNGIPVEAWRNQPNHFDYTDKIYQKLQDFISSKPNANPTECYNELLRIIGEAKQAIVNNATLKINDLNF